MTCHQQSILSILLEAIVNAIFSTVVIVVLIELFATEQPNMWVVGGMIGLATVSWLYAYWPEKPKD